jgi:hypothetical protein
VGRLYGEFCRLGYFSYVDVCRILEPYLHHRCIEFQNTNVNFVNMFNMTGPSSVVM